MPRETAFTLINRLRKTPFKGIGEEKGFLFNTTVFINEINSSGNVSVSIDKPKPPGCGDYAWVNPKDLEVIKD